MIRSCGCRSGDIFKDTLSRSFMGREQRGLLTTTRLLDNISRFVDDFEEGDVFLDHFLVYSHVPIPSSSIALPLFLFLPLFSPPTSCPADVSQRQNQRVREN